MKLKKWLEREGSGALSRVSRDTGLAYTTVFDVAHGRRSARYATAKLISAATGGEVSIAEICEAQPRSA